MSLEILEDNFSEYFVAWWRSAGLNDSPTVSQILRWQ